MSTWSLDTAYRTKSFSFFDVDPTLSKILTILRFKAQLIKG